MYGAGLSSQGATNLIINGDFRVNQFRALNGILGPTTVNGANQRFYDLSDAWGYQGTSGNPQGINNAILYDDPVTGTRGFSAAIGVPSGFMLVTDYIYLFTSLEGLEFAPLYGQRCTLSFYAKSPVVGPHALVIYNGAAVTALGGSDTFLANYRILTAGAWEKQSISIDFPTTLAYPQPFDSNRQLQLAWIAYAGANVRVADSLVGVWTPSPGMNGYANVSAVDPRIVNNNTPLQIARVALKVGSNSNFVSNDFNFELARAQRRYWQTFPYGLAPVQQINPGIPLGIRNVGTLKYRAKIAGVFNDGFQVRYPVPMRTLPTITTYSPDAATANWSNITGGAASGIPALFNQATNNGNDIENFITNPQVAADAAGDLLAIHATFDARI